MGATLLLIDDSPSIARLVEARLAGEQHTLHYAATGDEGLALAKKVSPDLILLDVEMPAPDGFEVCRRLKVDPDLMNVPVIFLTGSGSTTEKILGLELGAVDFLYKPFDPADLRARVRTALTIKRLSDLLETRARVDSVTGLWNPVYFTARLANELSLAQRSGRNVGILLANIDRYTEINRQHGQRVGNEILLSVADIFASATRGEDVLCRAQGAELGIICPCSDTAGTATLAERLRDRVSRMISHAHGVELRVTVSMGVTDLLQASDPQKVDDKILCDVARRCIAEAKELGGDRVVIATPALWPDLTNVPIHYPFIERRGQNSQAA